MTDNEQLGTNLASNEQQSGRQSDAEPGRDRKKEGGQSGDTPMDAEILTPGGNVRHGGGIAQGVPMRPGDKESK